MKIHEFQAKKIFADYGIPVPAGSVARTPEEARAAAETFGGPVVVKVQVHAGGRGKAGGIRLAQGPQEAFLLVRDLLGKNLVTHQTGPEGTLVRQVLIEQSVAIASELYLGIVIDRSLGLPVLMASQAGGMAIEEVAAAAPEKIIRAAFDPSAGLAADQIRELQSSLQLGADLQESFSRIAKALARLFVDKDCSLIEINPLAVTRDHKLVALDAKISFDDDALFRHPDLKELHDPAELDALEQEALKYRLSYIKLDGNVGCMVNGAGLAMATMDIIKHAGGSPANFLDVGGGASAEQVEHALCILLADSNVRAVLINIFGGILRCDRVANGIVEAAKKTSIDRPMVIRLDGTNAQEGRQILEESGLNFEVASSFDDAARRVARCAGR